MFDYIGSESLCDVECAILEPPNARITKFGKCVKTCMKIDLQYICIETCILQGYVWVDASVKQEQLH